MTTALAPARTRRERPAKDPDAWLTAPDIAATGRIIALIPAHNEEVGIVPTIRSLQRQQQAPDHIIVMADNCTDATVCLARLAGAEVRETVGNTAKKAGALNQGLAAVLPGLQDEDFILAMDADSQLEPDFLANAMQLFGAHEHVGGLSGRIVAREHGNFIELAQAIEYSRGVRQVGRRGGKVHVLSGAAAVIGVGVLRHIADARGTQLPGQRGAYFLEDSLTEDYELTLAIRTLGYACVSTKHCRVITDVMPTLRDLTIQRNRWYRGAMESLNLYGWIRQTHKTWFSLGANYAASLLAPLVLVLIALSILLFDSWFDPRWLLLWPIMMAEQYTMARRVGVKLWQAPLLFFPLWAYDVLLWKFSWSSLLAIAHGADRIWVTGTSLDQPSPQTV
jgi:poly-beta-1,6-N-acetyl-D-glucosamine synthase